MDRDSDGWTDCRLISPKAQAARHTGCGGGGGDGGGGGGGGGIMMMISELHQSLNPAFEKSLPGGGDSVAESVRGISGSTRHWHVTVCVITSLL